MALFHRSSSRIATLVVKNGAEATAELGIRPLRQNARPAFPSGRADVSLERGAQRMSAGIQ
jgi:hypothetical protein